MGLASSSVKVGSLECLFRDINVHIGSHNCCYRRLKTKLLNEFLEKFSKPSLAKNNIHPFTAALLDYYFQPFIEGVIEIGGDDIIFYYILKGERHSLNWPLKHIRWYGGNSNTFVFESGRLCEYGSSYFSFKCKESRKLVSCLKKQEDLILRLKHQLKPSTLSHLSDKFVPNKNLLPKLHVVSAPEHNVEDKNCTKIFCQDTASSSYISHSDDYITLSKQRSSVNNDSNASYDDDNNTQTVYLNSPSLSTIYLYPKLIDFPVTIQACSQTSELNLPSELTGEDINSNLNTNYSNNTNTDDIHDNYLQIVPASDQHLTNSAISSSDMGQYLIALALPFYVNQPAMQVLHN